MFMAACGFDTDRELRRPMLLDSRSADDCKWSTTLVDCNDFASDSSNSSSCAVSIASLVPDGCVGLSKSDVYPNEYAKTGFAFLFLLAGLFVSCLALATVHDKQPNIEPLPDIVFRFIPQLDGGLEISEYLIMLVTYPTFFIVLFHRHR